MSAVTHSSSEPQATPPSGDSAAASANLAFGVALATAALFAAAYASLISSVSNGTPWMFQREWIPRLGVELAFRVDGLSLLFGLLISGIGVLVVIYSYGYFKTHKSHARLQWLLLAFMLAMLGLVTADNILLLFVFWELTTVTSFLLVGFDHENAKARRSALQALLVTGGGGLALLVGLIMLGNASDSYLLSEIIAQGIANGPGIAEHPHYPIILTLILLGAFTKSAQFPFHFWLPNAMAAPSPVSAYLHSATMVKAGIYLMMRLQPSLGGTDAWFYTLIAAGAITAVWSSMMALRQTDMKLMLAWTTVMALGTITMFLASDLRIAALAAVTFLLVHAFYKCALFLVIGNVDKGTGTREIHKLGSLIKHMPITSIVASLAALSMAGLPPFLGFIGKELKYEGALAIADNPWLVVAAAVSANAMMVAIALSFVFRVFLGGQSAITRTPREVSVLMWAGPLLLAAAGLATGIFPDILAKTIIQPAVGEILATTTEVKLSLWHGINGPLILSIVTVALGLLMFFKFIVVGEKINTLVATLRVSGDNAYEYLLNGVIFIAKSVTNRLQTGSLSHYLTIVLSVFVISVAATMLYQSVGIFPSNLSPVSPLVLLIVTLMILAAIVVAFSSSRLLSICALGIVGSGVAVLFLIFGAIDVAITQLMVETLFVVLIATVLVKLPRFPMGQQQHPGRGGVARDAVIAIAAGVIMTIITLGVSLAPLDLSVTQFFEENSLTKAYGRNIVNVILVDFRALDTLGEVAVVATAAMAVIALLKVRAHPQRPHA
ncbi:proton-conducting transporter membrane subunit [bacterium]|nr:proton-conducting transporter membrane subunit [bacterium]